MRPRTTQLGEVTVTAARDVATTSPVSVGRRLGGVLRLLHPFPSAMNTVATLLFATLALGAPPAWPLALTLAAAIFASQGSIGIANDWADRHLDLVTKSYKPLAAGLVTPRTALGLLAVALTIVGICAASLGLASFLLVALGTGLGLAYDLRLKRTAYSWLPYLLAIPLEPIWVWTALGRFTPRLLWLYPLGAALLLALHLANALADLDGDTVAAVGGLVQRLGRRRAERALWIAAFLPGLLALLLGGIMPYRWRWFLPALVLSCLPTLAGRILVWRRPGDERAFRTTFGLLIVSTIVLAVGWLAAAI